MTSSTIGKPPGSVSAPDRTLKCGDFVVYADWPGIGFQNLHPHGRVPTDWLVWDLQIEPINSSIRRRCCSEAGAIADDAFVYGVRAQMKL